MKVVTTNGVFDILHCGHLRTLQKAKEMGDYLIVCINSDSSVRRLKGEFRPIHNQYERKDLLEALKYVDEVRIFYEDDPREILNQIKPDVHVKSREGYKGIEKEVVESNGGKIVLINHINGYSTTDILKKAYNVGYFERPNGQE